MKDLARLLEFINKDPDKVRMPADGLRLVDKAETLLENYLAGQVKSRRSCCCQGVVVT